MFEIALLVTQLVQASLLLEHTLSLVQEVLASLPVLTIVVGALLLFLPPVALAPVVVVTVTVVVVATAIPVAITIAIRIPATLLLQATLLFELLLLLLLALSL